MSHAPDARLERLLGGPHLAALRRKLRRHFANVKLGESMTFLRLSDLNPQEHETLAGLTGRPPRYKKSMQIDVAAIDTSLRNAGIAASLFNALEQIDGPIVHLATVRAETQASWSAVVTGCEHPNLTAYLNTQTGLGLLKRLSRQSPQTGASMRAKADAVLHRLPANGLPRAQLAAETLGDAHALDAGKPLATLVLAVWRQDSAYAAKVPGESLDARENESARAVWARAGVLVNELAKPVLYLNLPARGRRQESVPGEPVYASLRKLIRSPVAWDVAGRNVYVCENPNLVAIASDRLGAKSAPLVCTDGMPSAAQNTLLAQLIAAGCRLIYHGDFDWPGLHIANHVMSTHGARPWRYSAADYEAAVANSAGRHALIGKPTPASWDAQLMPTMQTHGLCIPEEGVAAFLIPDLKQGIAPVG